MQVSSKINKKYIFKVTKVLGLREREKPEGLVSYLVTVHCLTRFTWQLAICMLSVGSSVHSATFFLEEIENNCLDCAYLSNNYFCSSRKSVLSSVPSIQSIQKGLSTMFLDKKGSKEDIFWQNQDNCWYFDVVFMGVPKTWLLYFAEFSLQWG